MSNTEKLVKATIEGIQEKKGHNITVIDLKEIDDTITQFWLSAKAIPPHKSQPSPIRCATMCGFMQDRNQHPPTAHATACG